MRMGDRLCRRAASIYTEDQLGEEFLTGKYQEIIPDDNRKEESLHLTENLKESTCLNSKKRMDNSVLHTTLKTGRHRIEINDAKFDADFLFCEIQLWLLTVVAY